MTRVARQEKCSYILQINTATAMADPPSLFGLVLESHLLLHLWLLEHANCHLPPPTHRTLSHTHTTQQAQGSWALGLLLLGWLAGLLEALPRRSRRSRRSLVSKLVCLNGQGVSLIHPPWRRPNCTLKHIRTVPSSNWMETSPLIDGPVYHLHVDSGGRGLDVSFQLIYRQQFDSTNVEH